MAEFEKPPTRDGAGNIMGEPHASPYDEVARKGGFPSAAGYVHRTQPELVPDLDTREKALGQRYFAEDRKTFTEELQEHQRRNPHLHANQVARDVMARRQQKEGEPRDKELVATLLSATPQQRQMMKFRMAAGLPAIQGKD